MTGRPPLTVRRGDLSASLHITEIDDTTAYRLIVAHLDRTSRPPARHDDWQPRPCPPRRHTVRTRTARIAGEVLL
jgi:hypothetical protein